MNNTFPLQQTPLTGNLDSESITRQYKLNLMTRFMEIKSLNPKVTQIEIAKELGYPTSSLHDTHDINMLSPYRNTPISHKRKQKNSNQEHDLQRHQMTSNDPKEPQLTSNDAEVKHVKSKNRLKSGGEIEINQEFLHEILHKNNL